jgi:hypothetical protein
MTCPSKESNIYQCEEEIPLLLLGLDDSLSWRHCRYLGLLLHAAWTSVTAFQAKSCLQSNTAKIRGILLWPNSSHSFLGFAPTDNMSERLWRTLPLFKECCLFDFEWKLFFMDMFWNPCRQWTEIHRWDHKIFRRMVFLQTSWAGYNDPPCTVVARFLLLLIGKSVHATLQIH